MTKKSQGFQRVKLTVFIDIDTASYLREKSVYHKCSAGEFIEKLCDFHKRFMMSVGNKPLTEEKTEEYSEVRNVQINKGFNTDRNWREKYGLKP